MTAFVTPKTGKFSFTAGAGRFVEDCFFTVDQRDQMRDEDGDIMRPDDVHGSVIDQIVGEEVLSAITVAIHTLKACFDQDVISFIVHRVSCGDSLDEIVEKHGQEF